MQWRQFAWNANPVFLEEWEKYFKMSSVENLTQNFKRYGLQNKSRMGLCMAKTYNNLYEETNQPAHSEPAHQ